MNRVTVAGGSGSGKSVFAAKLAAICRLPLYHLDNVFWNPDKTHVDRETFDRRLNVILEYERFVIDGEYGRTLEARIRESDTVFYFDIPLTDRLEGAASRIGKKRPDIPWIEEEFDPDFKKYIESYDKEQRPVTLSLLEKYRDRNIVVFHSRADADEYLLQIKKPL